MGDTPATAEHLIKPGFKQELKHRASCGSPIDAGDVDDHINHVTAQLIGLHVHWAAVGGDVNLTDHIEQEGLLNT